MAHTGIRARPQVPHWDWVELRRRARAAARPLLSDPHDLEDAVQEAMTRAWRQRAKCRSAADPGPWLAQIARNEAYRLLQHKRGRGVPSPFEDQPEVDDGREPMDERLVRRLTVGAALAGLSAQDRELVRLRYGSDLEHPALAEALGMPEGTVKVRLHRIRKRLRREMTEVS